MEDSYIIKDFDAFIEATRVLVFNTFSEQKNNVLDHNISNLHEKEVNELDSVLSQSECILIAEDFITKQTNKKTKEKRYIITDSNYMSMVEAFNSRMVSNILSNLVNKGIIDSAYDEDKNDFVFWIKNN
jgi:predicted AAA+ superfamily ATPase